MYVLWFQTSPKNKYLFMHQFYKSAIVICNKLKGWRRSKAGYDRSYIFLLLANAEHSAMKTLGLLSYVKVTWFLVETMWKFSSKLLHFCISKSCKSKPSLLQKKQMVKLAVVQKNVGNFSHGVNFRGHSITT